MQIKKPSLQIGFALNYWTKYMQKFKKKNN